MENKDFKIWGEKIQEKFRLIEAIDPIKEELLKRRIDIKESITEPPVCLSISTPNGKSVIASEGNFSLIIGKAKSRKSTFLQLVVSALLARNNEMLEVGYSDNNFHILYIDTEQTRPHCTIAAQRIQIASGLTEAEFDKRFFMYTFRQDTPEGRKGFLEWLATHTENKIGAIIIDGVRDLMATINDEFEATYIAHRLMAISEQLCTHIFVVLHQNKNDSNARGHVGTELVNKAETVITVALDNNNRDVSVISCYASRNLPFDSFAITLDNYIPIILEDYSIKQSSRIHKPNFSPSNLEDKQHIEVLSSIFTEVSIASKNDLKTHLKGKFHNLGISLSDVSLRQLVEYYERKGFIENKSNTSYKKNYSKTDLVR